MALTSSFPIDLLDIQNETSSSSLVGASNAAGFTLPTSMGDFLGYSAAWDAFPPNTYWQITETPATINTDTLIVSGTTGFDQNFNQTYNEGEISRTDGNLGNDQIPSAYRNATEIEIDYSFSDTYSNPVDLLVEFSDTKSFSILSIATAEKEVTGTLSRRTETWTISNPQNVDLYYIRVRSNHTDLNSYDWTIHSLKVKN